MRVARVCACQPLHRTCACTRISMLCMDACALQNTRLHCTAARCSAGWFGQAAIQKRAAVQEWLAIVEDWSSLRVAAACRLPRIAKFLLRRGADPDDLTASSPPLAALKAAAQPSPWPSSMVVEGTTSIGGRGYGASPAAFFGAHAASSEATKGLNNNTNDGGGGGSGGGGGAVGGSGGYKGGGGFVWVPVVCQQTLRLMRVRKQRVVKPSTLVLHARDPGGGAHYPADRRKARPCLHGMVQSIRCGCGWW